MFSYKRTQIEFESDEKHIFLLVIGVIIDGEFII